MVPSSNARQPANLEQLAEARFAILSDAEIKLLRRAPKGKIAYCGPSERDDDPNNNPANAGNWSSDRWIRAELIRWLCVDRDAKERVDPRGIRAHAARITGKLDLSFVVVPFFLGLLRCSLSDDLDLSFTEIPSIDLSGTCLPSLNADHATVKGSISLQGLWSKGTVQLRGVHIGGNLDCEGGKFQNPAKPGIVGSGIALEAVNAKVAGDVLLRAGFAAEGMVRLYGAEIGGTLACDGATFQNPAVANVAESGTALMAEGAKVARDVLLRNGFTAEGQVWLYGAEIGGTLECDGGKFRNPARADVAGSGLALIAEGAKVAGAVLLRNEFAAEGQVRLFGAEIGGNLECQSGTFDSLNLTNASAGAILDDEESWPKSGKLFLDGFAYGRIAGGSVVARKRLAWLARQTPFTRHPYRQLAKVLKETGDDRGWRRVCAKMERKTWAGRSWMFRPLSWLLRGTIGYGYFSIRALWWLLALVIVGSVVYGRGYQAGSIVPTEKGAYDSFAADKRPPGYYEAFHALPYSLENSFPLVKFGVQDKWAPGPEAQVANSQPASWTSRILLLITSARFLRWFRWGQICAGWILATLFVSGVTGVIRKD